MICGSSSNTQCQAFTQRPADNAYTHSPATSDCELYTGPYKKSIQAKPLLLPGSTLLNTNTRTPTKIPFKKLTIDTTNLYSNYFHNPFSISPNSNSQKSLTVDPTTCTPTNTPQKHHSIISIADICNTECKFTNRFPVNQSDHFCPIDTQIHACNIFSQIDQCSINDKNKQDFLCKNNYATTCTSSNSIWEGCNPYYTPCSDMFQGQYGVKNISRNDSGITLDSKPYKKEYSNHCVPGMKCNPPSYQRNSTCSTDNSTLNDSRKFGCEKCGKKFTRPSTLRTHMNSHTGERPFMCHGFGCKWRFSVSSNLNRHIKVCPVLKAALKEFECGKLTTGLSQRAFFTE